MSFFTVLSGKKAQGTPHRRHPIFVSCAHTLPHKAPVIYNNIELNGKRERA
jgi:hypothetical protein